MQCPACHREVSDVDAVYCPRCGSSLPAGGGTAPIVPPDPGGPPPGNPTPPSAGFATPPPWPAVTSPLPVDVRNWAMGMHLAAFAAFLLPLAGWVIGPLVLWLVKREAHPFIDEHGKESLNFNLSVTIYGIAAAILVLVLVGILLLAAVGVAWLVLTIIAAVKAANGEAYRYPLTIRFVT